ncbi:MAG: hypothetical protein K2J80_02310 [Oscillospiraceae bacterium]|nr:hypothetical protein [Oscillospiraceae bacterium]
MENNYAIEDLIDSLEDLIHSAMRVPFGKKSMIDVDKVAEIVADIRIALPTEIKQAQNVVQDKNNIISDAKREAEMIIRKAEQRREELIDQSDIMKEARRRSTEIISQAQNRSSDLRVSTNDFADKMLARIENLLAGDINNIKVLRSSINSSMNGIQTTQPTIAPIEKPGE